MSENLTQKQAEEEHKKLLTCDNDSQKLQSGGVFFCDPMEWTSGLDASFCCALSPHPTPDAGELRTRMYISGPSAAICSCINPPDWRLLVLETE